MSVPGPHARAAETALVSDDARRQAAKPKAPKAAPKVDICVVQAQGKEWSTEGLFDKTQNDPAHSAIDQFFEATRNLNMLLPPRDSYNPQLGHLVLLGHMSAVESYFRTMIRRVILLDKVAQKAVHDLDINYAAAQHQRDLRLLPEALFEKTSFSSATNIPNALKDFLGIKGHVPAEISGALIEYGKVCQIRHCLVHRFGKLGSRNAVILGIASHSRLMEKPLSVSYEDIQIAFDILRQCVTVINNFVFRSLIARIDDWKGVWRSDRRLFTQYYDLFSNTSGPTPSKSAQKVYELMGKLPN